MNLDSLTHTSGEWLRGTGPESDIVISSRIRLARNLAAFPFTNRASAHQKADIESLLRERIAKLDVTPRLNYIPVAPLSALDRQFLVERQLVGLRPEVLADQAVQDGGQVQLLLLDQLLGFGAGLAEVHLLLDVVHDVGQMHGGRLGTELTLHAVTLPCLVVGG